MIRAVAVVVPAHDEERLLGGCLESVRRAAAHPRLRGLPVTTVVAADSCRDATAEVARGHGATVLEVAARRVGAARSLATGHVLARLTGPGGALRAAEVWLAHTDADSRVPADWLAHQLDLAEAGFHAVVGLVEVADWSEHPAGVAERFHRRYHGYPGEQPHPHVHGANLAVRADAYTAAGGFPPLAVGEDHALVAALEAAGRRIHRTETHPVRTSARRTPRAPHGFGDLLLTL
ncbi:glycosyltransferase [Streptomyces sp. NPDC092296]|uniref:glycosyltransferase n=1 Tax=Streptomyces sp. NPDC092296 TaxID=3366012 RepID=UPI0038198B4A